MRLIKLKAEIMGQNIFFSERRKVFKLLCLRRHLFLIINVKLCPENGQKIKKIYLEAIT